MEGWTDDIIDQTADEIMKAWDDPEMIEKRKNFPKFDYDNFEAEMKRHPFFMKEGDIVSEEDIANSPELQALQALKYDCEYEYDKAMELKNDGNAHFKIKAYKKAIIAYSAALALRVDELPPPDSDEEEEAYIKKMASPDMLNAQIATNRGTMQYQLKNYRSCVKDCTLAIRFESSYEKAYRKAIIALQKINRHDEIQVWATKALEKFPDSKDFKDFRSEALKKQKEADRNERKRQADKRKVQREKAKLVAIVKSREYGMDFDKSFIKEMVSCIGDEHVNLTEESEPWLLTLVSSLVKTRITVSKADENKALTFPITFMYPQYQTTDLVEYCDERTFISDLLADMFSARPGWDEEGAYNPVDIELYSYNTKSMKYKLLNAENPMWTFLKSKDVLIHNGMTSMYVVSRKSRTFYNDWKKKESFV